MDVCACACTYACIIGAYVCETSTVDADLMMPVSKYDVKVVVVWSCLGEKMMEGTTAMNVVRWKKNTTKRKTGR
jgi:hypothetical protein